MRVKRLLQRVYQSWNQRALRWGLCRWADLVNERLYNRDLVTDAISMWSHVREIHAFRTLDEFAQEQIHYRKVVNKFRRRFELRPAQMAISAWGELVAEEQWRQKQVRKFCFKFRNREVVYAFARMKDAVQDRQLEERQKLVDASPVLMRLIKRPAVLAIGWWRAGIERRQHLRKAGNAVADKRNRIWMWDAIDRWANVFVDLSFQDRMQELRSAAFTALETKDLSGVIDVLHSHAAWSRPRMHSRSNLTLDNFLSTSDSFDTAVVARRASSLRRVARTRRIALRGARPPSPDKRKLQLDDILRLQKGLARETGGEAPLYWRAVETLSVILKGQTAHPLAPGAFEAADAEGPEVEEEDYEQEDVALRGFTGIGGSTGIGVLNGKDLVYAATPPATAREDNLTIETLSWEGVARVNVMHPKLQAQKQIVPTYLGGRYSHLGIEKLRSQVHERYPLKWSKTWQTMQHNLEDAELARRYFRARRKSLAAINQQALKPKAASVAAAAAEQEALECEEIVGMHSDQISSIRGEAARLEEENPFQNASSIRKMRKRSEVLQSQLDEAAARGAMLEQTAMEYRRMQEEEERQLNVLVQQSVSLLQDHEEALRLLDWQAVEPTSPSDKLSVLVIENGTTIDVTVPLAGADAGGVRGGVKLPEIWSARPQQQPQQQVCWHVSTQVSFDI